jgi:hypothetical protein
MTRPKIKRKRGMRKARRTACMPMEVAPIIITSSPIFHADEVSVTSITFSLLSAEEQCPLTLLVELLDVWTILTKT